MSKKSKKIKGKNHHALLVPKQEQDKDEFRLSRQGVMRDLRKTLLFSVLAIGGLFVILLVQ